MIKVCLFKGDHLIMPSWLLNVLGAAGSVVLSLSVTLIFNKLVGWPKELKKQKAAAAQREAQLQQENHARDIKIAALENAVNALPGYRAQSLSIQAQLQNTDKEILGMCSAIKDSVKENQDILNYRLDRLEKREKNTYRAKILDEYRLFTDERKNPMRAWSEMEHHAFFELVKDYEDLGGNDYVHSTVLPAMNELEVVQMSNKPGLAELMASRTL
jgi:mRNA-degrading endonuclease RelE of RelBE toxin-antitoxin system